MAINYIPSIAESMGTPIWFLSLVLIWILVWKLLALWKAARNKHLVWFILLAIINTLGILEILYVFIFSKLSIKKNPKQILKRKVKTKKIPTIPKEKKKSKKS